MGRGSWVTPEEVADYKERAARLDVVRAKNPRKYPGATWDYLVDTSPWPARIFPCFRIYMIIDLHITF